MLAKACHTLCIRCSCALERLETVSNRASPLCPFMTDEEVLRRLEGPQNAKAQGWARESRKKKQPYVAEDEEVAAAFGIQGKLMQHTLKFKLRDHVSEIFSALSSIDDSTKISNATDSFRFDDRMKKEMGLVEKEYRRKKNESSIWAEQQAKARMIGMEARH